MLKRCILIDENLTQGYWGVTVLKWGCRFVLARLVWLLGCLRKLACAARDDSEVGSATHALYRALLNIWWASHMQPRLRVPILFKPWKPSASLCEAFTVEYGRDDVLRSVSRDRGCAQLKISFFVLWERNRTAVPSVRIATVQFDCHHHSAVLNRAAWF